MDTAADHDERLEREREYHNQRFTEEVRTEQKKFYLAIGHGAQAYQEAVREAAKDADVLDFGCGLGKASLELAPICKSVRGIDISDVAVGKANERAAELGYGHCRYIAMNAEQLDFPDASFDVVFGMAIIHHLDIAASCGEIRRVLRPGGIAIFYEPLGHNAIYNMYRDRTPKSRTPDEHPLLRSDFVTMERIFSKIDTSFYGLTTLAAVPFRQSALFQPLLGVFRAVDALMLRLPVIKWQGWYALMRMRA
jgi:SAM-dependent methyltransferase